MRAARVALAVVTVALVAAVGVIVWLTMRGNQAQAAPIPGPGEARAVVADPSIELPYLVEVPGTADGCPAAAFASPVEPLTVTDGYAGVMLPRGNGAALLATCIGAVDDMGTVEDVVADVWSGEGLEDLQEDLVADMEWERLSIERITSPFGDALAVTSRLGTKLLTDHYVERDGWVYAVGYLRAEADADVDRGVVDAILASWQWR